MKKTAEMKALDAYVRQGIERRGLDLTHAPKGPRSCDLEPMIWIETYENSRRRTVMIDDMPDTDGTRAEIGVKTQFEVRIGVEDGLPTQKLYDAIDAVLDWRSHETRWHRHARDAGGVRDWMRTIHVYNLIAIGRPEIMSLLTAERRTEQRAKPLMLHANTLVEKSGYVGGRTDIGTRLTNGVTMPPWLSVAGRIPDTAMAALIGKPLSALVDFAALRDCPPVKITDVRAWGVTGSAPTQLMIEVEDVRVPLAPIPDGINANWIIPPTARLAERIHMPRATSGDRHAG